MAEKREQRERPEPGNYADTRIRWPDENWRKSEQPAGEWPQSRATGREPAAGVSSSELPEVPGFGNRPRRERGGPDVEGVPDESILKEVCEDLEADPDCDTTEIDVEVRDGAVVLEGRVPTRPMKQRAAEIANAARGVRTVDNRLQVA